MIQLREQLSKLQADREEVVATLRAQIGEAERTKKKAITDLQTAERRAELAEKKLECNSLILIEFSSFFFLIADLGYLTL